jgi:LacI family transcriptional regulator
LGEKLTKEKAHKFEDAVSKLGGDNITIIESTERFEDAGKDAVDKLLALRSDCTAIICAYDNIALGAIKQLKNKGLSVPDDISVIGIDNIVMGKYAETALTTIGVDFEEVCSLVCDILKKKLKNPYYKTYKKIVIKGELIVRESIKRI